MSPIAEAWSIREDARMSNTRAASKVVHLGLIVTAITSAVCQFVLSVPLIVGLALVALVLTLPVQRRRLLEPRATNRSLHWRAPPGEPLGDGERTVGGARWRCWPRASLPCNWPTHEGSWARPHWGGAGAVPGSAYASSVRDSGPRRSPDQGGLQRN